MLQKIREKFTRQKPVIISSIGIPKPEANKEYLEKILANEEPYTYVELILFLAKAFSAENIFFLALCDQYKKDPTISLLSFIYLNYMKRGSAFEVNLPDKEVLNPFEARYEALNMSIHSSQRFRAGAVGSRAEGIMPRIAYAPHDILDAARLQIFKLIERDPFTRFVTRDSTVEGTDEIAKEIKRLRDPIFQSNISLPAAFYVRL